MDSGSAIELAALGRPFALGMLYDMRNDSLVTGMTLWDEAHLTKHIQTREQNYNEFEIITSDSLQTKSSDLNVDASLNLSILSGKVKVAGSGNFLKDNKTSKHQERVTLRYKETKLFKELSMYQLGKLQYQSVIDTDLATHVVTGILYGAQAFFVFEQEVSNDENHQNIHVDLKIMIKKIPKFSGQIKADVKIDSDDQKKVDKMSCRFFGDVCLDKSPTTFQDAIEAYKSLPRLLAETEKAVPITVFMLPLTSLSSSASRLVHQINVGLVQEAQTIMEDFIKLEMRCNDALKTSALQPFTQVGEKITCFKDLCAGLKLEFQQSLAEKLPLIRGGKGEEAELADILKRRYSSDFNSEALNQWVNQKEKEIYTLMLLKEKMKNTTFFQSETQLYKEVFSVEHAVCFVFTSLGSDDPFLSALSTYLSRTGPDDHSQDRHGSEMDEIKKKAKLFSDFAEANKDNQKVKFLAVVLTDDNHKDSTIYRYEDGFLINENYEPPSKPETVTVADQTQNSVTLKVSPPRFGAENITSYSVEVQVLREDGWKEEVVSKSGEVTVGDLKPNTEYVFRCRAVTSAGVGPASEVTGPIRT